MKKIRLTDIKRRRRKKEVIQRLAVTIDQKIYDEMIKIRDNPEKIYADRMMALRNFLKYLPPEPITIEFKI